MAKLHAAQTRVDSMWDAYAASFGKPAAKLVDHVFSLVQINSSYRVSAGQLLACCRMSLRNYPRGHGLAERLSVLVKCFARQLLARLTAGLQPAHVQVLAMALATTIHVHEGKVESDEATLMFASMLEESNRNLGSAARDGVGGALAMDLARVAAG